MKTLNTLWTIGHSTHTLEYFVEELQSFNIEMVVDVRSLPGSNKFPQFNMDNLQVQLPQMDIEYCRIEQLGGRRRANPNSIHTVWKNVSFRSYADYMDTAEFLEGIDKLTAIATTKRTTLMCAEAVWWRCHRSMIADYMKSIGWEVINIMGVDKSVIHPYTSAAQIVDGKLFYGS